jgi:hypothetical protein
MVKGLSEENQRKRGLRLRRASSAPNACLPRSYATLFWRLSSMMRMP